MNKHRGTIVPMVSPFTKELTLDQTAAETMVDRLASNGLGVFVLGTTGEAASIPSSMRNKLVEIASNVANGRVPVYAGIGDNCVLDSISSAKVYLGLGADAVVAPLPAYYSLTQIEMLEYFEHLSQNVDGPIVPYNIPQTTRMSIPPEVIEKLADRPNIVGFKDSENQPGRLEKIAALGGREDFSIFMGVSRLSYDALKNGYDGLVPSSGNIAPEMWVDFVTLVDKGEWEAALDLQEQLDRVASVFQRNCTLGQSLATLKLCMAALNLCQHYVLPPLKTRNLSEAPEVLEELEELMKLTTTPAKDAI